MSSDNGKNQVIVQGSILAVASLIVRFIGLIYRIPMTRIIGDTGIGYYSTAYQVYNVVLLLSSYSMPQALSKLMAGKLAKRQYRNTNRYFLCTLSVSVFAGAVFSSIMYFGSGFIAGTLLNADMAEYSLKVLAPTVFIMSILGVFRGFFQGFETMVPTAVSQIIEQIINAIVSIVCAAVLFVQGHRIDLVKGTKNYSAAFGAQGGTLGTLWGAIAALVFIIFVFVIFYGDFRKKMRREPAKRVYPYKRVYKEIYGMVIPIIMSTVIFHVLNIIDNGVYNFFMRRTSIDEKTYMAIWGVYSGKFQLLINLPISIATAMASSIIPQLSRAVEKRDKVDIHKKIDSSLRFTTLITIPCMVGLAALGDDIVELLFGKTATAADAGMMLITGGLSVLFFAYATISNGILHGLGKMYSTVINALIALGVHLVVLFAMLWLFDFGIYSVVIAYTVFGMTVFFLNNYRIYSCTGYAGTPGKTYIRPFLASVVMGIVVFGLNLILKKSFVYILVNKTLTNAFSLIVSMTAGIFIYFVVAIALKTADEADLLEMPMGGRMVKYAKKLRLL
jgi:stage V sporulation protein B